MGVTKTNISPKKRPNTVDVRVVAIYEYSDPNPYYYSVRNQKNTNNTSSLGVADALISRYKDAWDKLAD